jgi:hypothetical protein
MSSAWSLICSADVLVSHYTSSSFIRLWNTLWIVPLFGWRVWICGLCLITVGFLFEVSFRRVRDITKQYDQVLEAERANQKKPRVFLTYSQAPLNTVDQHTGLFATCDEAMAFNVEISVEPVAGFSLCLEEPTIPGIDVGASYPVRLKAVKIDGGRQIPIGGLPHIQLKSFFERISYVGEDCCVVAMVKYKDFERRSYESRCVIKMDFWSDRVWCEIL